MKNILNIASVAIVYKASDPSKIFLEIKDNTHPLLLVRNKFCFIGGNWIGKEAISDKGPLDTIRRELKEELTLTKKNVNTKELVELGIATQSEEYQVLSQAQPSEYDIIMLRELARIISNKLTPFGLYLNTVTSKAILSADPNSTRDGFTSLCCYWKVALNDTHWMHLSYLQDTYKNLSNESISAMLSLEEIIGKNIYGAFCHDKVLKDFFLSMGLTRAHKMKIVPNQKSVYAGPIKETYEEYLKEYNVIKKPI